MLSRILILIAVYFLAGKGALMLAATGGGYAAPVWPATGLSIAALLLYGSGLWPGIWLGAFLVNVSVDDALLAPRNLGLAALIATGNTLEALMTLRLLRGRFDSITPLNSVANVQRLFGAIMAGPAVSATIGTVALLSFGRLASVGILPATWMTWWVGDFLGALVFTPMLVFLTKAPQSKILRVPAPELPYVAGLLVIVGAFSTASGLPEAQPFTVAFLGYSALLWCALRLSPRHLFLAVAALNCIMIFAAYEGYRPFNLLPDVVQRLLLLQFFVGCGTSTAIILSAMVSERLHRDAALIHSEKMAALGRMAGGIAHEVLNPLSVIAGKTALLRAAVDSGKLEVESLAAALDKIDATAWRISKITRSLQSFARNAESDPFQEVPVSKIISDTLDFCGQRFKQRNIDFSIEPVASDVVLRCQPVQISQVLLNLLNNAFDAVEQSPGEKWIRVSVRDSGGTLELSVSDSGPGVPSEHLHRIFEPFFTTKEVGEGTGLGLSVSTGIVKHHGGTLTLDASTQHTKFVVRLPLDRG